VFLLAAYPTRYTEVAETGISLEYLFSLAGTYHPGYVIAGKDKAELDGRTVS